MLGASTPPALSKTTVLVFPLTHFYAPCRKQSLPLECQSHSEIPSTACTFGAGGLSNSPSLKQLPNKSFPLFYLQIELHKGEEGKENPLLQETLMPSEWGFL